MREILGSRAPVRILELFCKNPQREFYTKEIEKKSRLSKATTIKWLRKLTRERLLTEYQEGRKRIYKLQWNNPFSKEVRRLLTTAELVSALERSGDLSGVYLFGPATSGSDPPDTELDLLVLTRADSAYIKNILGRVSRKIGRKIKPLIMSPLEYSELSKNNPSLHERIEREKIRLLPL